MAVITLSEAKALLQITSTSYDTLITSLIPIVESEIREYTNQNWQDSPTLPSWASWMKLPVSQMIGWVIGKSGATGLKSESIGTYAWTADDSKSGWPSSIMSAFDKVKISRLGFAQKTGNYREGRGLYEWWATYQLPYGNVNEVIE